MLKERVFICFFVRLFSFLSGRKIRTTDDAKSRTHSRLGPFSPLVTVPELRCILLGLRVRVTGHPSSSGPL